MNPFWNIIQESLYTAIQEHPIIRILKIVRKPVNLLEAFNISGGLL